MSRTTYNFCAGPAALPQAVMQRAQQELLDWQGLGVSVMEISHRSDEYQAMAINAENNLRQLLGIEQNYAVLFLPGGASLQFSNIPISLLAAGQTAEYITNGVWGNKAAEEAARFGNINQINALNINQQGFRELVDSGAWLRTDATAYTHFTANETIEGIRFSSVPSSQGPIIADMSSCILSEQININDYSMIYAGAQKNIGPAGMSIVIIDRSLFCRMQFNSLPKVFNYQAQANSGSMVNTPPTYSWYLASLVFDWLLAQGGVVEMERLAKLRAKKLYQLIDMDDFYTNPIVEKDRSRMNVPFILKDQSLNKTFLAQAKLAGLVGLEGHRSVGGMRASLYNSMPLEGVERLIEFMLEFKQQYG